MTLTNNSLMRSFLLHEDNAAGKNQNLTPDTSTALQNLCRSLVNDTLDRQIHFTTGIGLTDSPTPMRLPSVMIPTLRVMRKLRELGITDMRYHVYQATDFIIGETGLDKETAKQNAHVMEKYLRYFIKKCYPDLQDAISLKFGFEIDAEALDRVSHDLEKYSQSDAFSPTLKRLIEYATSKGNSSGSAIRYTAANLMGNGNIKSSPPFPLGDNDVIIPIGGLKERPFFELGKSYESHKYGPGETAQTIPLIQRTGATPAYYPQSGEDTLDHHGHYRGVDTSHRLHPSVDFDRYIVLGELGRDIISSIIF